ncbi:MAG: tetratricopeptide repeat protein [Litorimonas sp.]
MSFATNLNKPQTVVIPERPPTFDELMVLADKDLAENDLIHSYIYSQDDGVGFKKVMALAQTGHTKAELMACYLLISGTGVKEDEVAGYSLCEIAAKKGSIPAQVNLIYRDFRPNPRNMNWVETYEAFNNLMETDPSSAHRVLQFLYRKDHPNASMSKMYYHLKEAIKHGNTNAMLSLSEEDLYVPSNEHRSLRRVEPRIPARAEKNLKKAYALNDFAAGFILALEYRDGNLLSQDTEQYVSMIKRMAVFLHPKSMGELAYMYSTGKGVEQDKAKANELFIRAAKFGNVYSQEIIAPYLLFGPENTRDYETGLRYLEDQARRGRVASMKSLSRHYRRSEIDDPENKYVTWLTRAATYGDEASQEMLGMGMMETGYVKAMQDYIEILSEFHEYGDPDASYLLARHYRAASGVPRDLAKAKSILSKFTHLDHPRIIQEMDIIEGYISHYGGIDSVPDIIER